jgi:septal ring factor EnvC (AmiA/AmiB activator)
LRTVILTVFFLILCSTSLLAETESSSQLVNEAKEIQQDINTFDDNTHKLSSEYYKLINEIDYLEKTNTMYEDQINKQGVESREIANQLKLAKNLRIELEPLINDQVAALEKFISIDTNQSSKRNSLIDLKKKISSSKLNLTEKFAEVIKSYKAQIQISKELWLEDENISYEKKDVEILCLNVGRLAKFCRDKKTGSYFSLAKGDKQLSPMPEKFNSFVDLGIQIARKEIAPQLLSLPLRVD